MLDGVLDGRNSTDNTLIVGDILVRVERDVEVNLWKVSVYSEPSKVLKAVLDQL